MKFSTMKSVNSVASFAVLAMMVMPSAAASGPALESFESLTVAPEPMACTGSYQLCPSNPKDCCSSYCFQSNGVAYCG